LDPSTALPCGPAHENSTMIRSFASTAFRQRRLLGARTSIPSSYLYGRQTIGLRFLSSSDSNKGSKEAIEDSSTKEDGETSNEIVLTPGQQVVAATRLGMWAGILLFASACAYYIGKELFPSKMSPNAVFNKALDVVRKNPEVKRRFGDTLKGYGRDHGGHREGRRNFIEHTEYTDENDGSKRTRVRFNLEGKFGHAFVFAEVSSAMKSGEFVYGMFVCHSWWGVV